MSGSLDTYATLAFVGIFMGIAAWAYWPGNRQKFEKDAQIPLHDDIER